MTTRHWDVRNGEARHAVTLEHGEGLGKVTVSVDGEEVVSGRADSGDFRFEIDGKPAVVRIKSEWLGLQHGYELTFDGEPVP